VGLLTLGAWQQASLVSPLREGVDQLKNAQQLQVVYTAQVVGEAPGDYKISFAKPNWFKIEMPDETIVGDGKHIYDYKSKDKSYTEVEMSDDELAKVWQRPEVWGWSPFFDEKFGAEVSTKAGAQRSVKGKTVVVVDGGKDALGEFSFFVDPATKQITGYSKKVDDSNLLVLASEITISDKPADAAMYAFVPPDGAHQMAVVTSATFQDVKSLFAANCLPCHAAARPSGGIDLTSYKGILGGVNPGDPANSLIIKSLRGKGAKQMPFKRAPLSEDKIAMVEAWIKAGAKEE
jgi:hypothetical protein